MTDLLGCVSISLSAGTIPCSSYSPQDSLDYQLTALPYGAFTRSSKRPVVHVYFEYICRKFAGRLLDRINTLLATQLICRSGRHFSLKKKHLFLFLVQIFRHLVTIVLTSIHYTQVDVVILKRFSWFVAGNGANSLLFSPPNFCLSVYFVPKNRQSGVGNSLFWANLEGKLKLRASVSHLSEICNSLSENCHFIMSTSF